jgi:hypothetical protein
MVHRSACASSSRCTRRMVFPLSGRVCPQRACRSAPLRSSEARARLASVHTLAMSDMSSSRAPTTPVEMSLPVSSERAACQAMFELLDGNIRCRIDGELSVGAEEGRYRFIDGVCFAAPAPENVGAALVGWLIESERASAVITRWRSGARAVLARDGAAVRVTGATVALHHEGAPIEDGFATHDGRLVFAHESDPPPVQHGSPPVVEAASDVARGHVDVLLDELDDEDDRPTTPPCSTARAALSTERMLHVLDEPSEPTQRRPRSHAAPPAWALSPMAAPGGDSPHDADEEVETSPRGARRTLDTGSS